MKYYVVYIVLSPAIRLAMKEFASETEAKAWAHKLPQCIVFKAKALSIVGHIVPKA